MTETTKRILELMKQTNTNAHQLEMAVELPNASIQGWVKGKKRSDGSMREISPAADSIAKCARYFNISADYLLGLTDDWKPLENREVERIASPTATVPAVFGEISDLLSERRFINTAKIYHELPDELRERAYGLICGIAIGLGLNIDKIIGR